MKSGNALVVPNFLKAGSLAALRRLCLKNNVKKGKQFHYFDIQYIEKERKWVCFYEEEVKLTI